MLLGLIVAGMLTSALRAPGASILLLPLCIVLGLYLGTRLTLALLAR